jgi:hypothetical protein
MVTLAPTSTDADVSTPSPYCKPLHKRRVPRRHSYAEKSRANGQNSITGETQGRLRPHPSFSFLSLNTIDLAAPGTGGRADLIPHVHGAYYNRTRTNVAPLTS